MIYLESYIPFPPEISQSGPFDGIPACIGAKGPPLDRLVVGALPPSIFHRKSRSLGLLMEFRLVYGQVGDNRP
eukprot:g80863.t1